MPAAQDQRSASTELEHVPYLDGWRGAAIIMVLLDHFAGVSALGMLGVQVFFVLSGLLMARLLFERRIALSTFYRRRIARILPALYIYLIGIGTWNLLVAGADNSFADFLLAAGFLGTYLPGKDIWESPLLGHLWSLNVEEHSYIALSVVALFSRQMKVRWPVLAITSFCGLCILAFAAHRAYPHLAPEGSSAMYVRTEVAALGVFASAAMHVALRKANWKPPAALFVIVAIATTGMVIWSATGLVRVGGNLLIFICIPIMLAMTVNLLMSAPQIVKDVLSSRLLGWFGLTSYSIYLWNYPFFILAGEYDDFWGRVARCGLSIAFGALSFRFAERPLRKWIADGAFPVSRKLQPDIRV